MGKLRQLFKSRRWYMTILGVSQALLGTTVGLSPEQSAMIVAGVAAWVLGDSIKHTE